MALAQQTDMLLLDEPTTFLDVTHQIEVLDLLTDLNRTRGHHHRDGAARPQPGRPLRRPPGRASREGRVHAAGDPAEVLTADRVHAVFGLRSRVILDPISGKPLVLPIGRHHTIAAVEG